MNDKIFESGGCAAYTELRLEPGLGHPDSQEPSESIVEKYCDIVALCSGEGVLDWLKLVGISFRLRDDHLRERQQLGGVSCRRKRSLHLCGLNWWNNSSLWRLNFRVWGVRSSSNRGSVRFSTR
jgi:hypothetical protein